MFQTTDAKSIARLEGGNMEYTKMKLYKYMNDDISSSALSTD